MTSQCDISPRMFPFIQDCVLSGFCMSLVGFQCPETVIFCYILSKTFNCYLQKSSPILLTWLLSQKSNTDLLLRMRKNFSGHLQNHRDGSLARIGLHVLSYSFFDCSYSNEHWLTMRNTLATRSRISLLWGKEMHGA